MDASSRFAIGLVAGACLFAPAFWLAATLLSSLDRVEWLLTAWHRFAALLVAVWSVAGLLAGYSHRVPHSNMPTPQELLGVVIGWTVTSAFLFFVAMSLFVWGC